MAEGSDKLTADDPFIRDGKIPLRDPAADETSISAADFHDSFGEDISQVLDLSKWRLGNDLSHEYRRVEREVSEAVERETDLQKKIREQVFPRLRTRQGAPPCAGNYRADDALTKKIHANLLFRGGMEACDGAMLIHDTLPLTIYQIGVALVSYQGDQGTWAQRLFRRDLEQSGANRIDEVIASLERRSRRSEEGLGELVQKALLDYAERAILLCHSKAPWVMGHGNPITYELLTGGANLELMVAGTNAVRDLVERKQKFVFVAQEPRERVALTIGHALQPMEYAVIGTLDEQLENWLHQKRFAVQSATKLQWDDEKIASTEWIPRIIQRVASKIVVGLFRATRVSPAQLFYAHVDHSHYAAHMVLADSMLQEQRGSPMLVEMAHHVCRSVFGDSLAGLADNAYASAGVPWRYSTSRSDR